MARPGIPLYVLARTLRETRKVTSQLADGISQSLHDQESNKVWVVHRNVKLKKDSSRRKATETEDKDYKNATYDSKRNYHGNTATSHNETNLPSQETHDTGAHKMDCLKSFSGASWSQMNDNNMENLKSVSHSSSVSMHDIGYASDEDTPIQVHDKYDTEADINEIALSMKIKTELPSLLLHRFVHAGIMILAVDSELSEETMELYIRTLGELGTYSVLTRAGYSELIVVNIGDLHDQPKKVSDNKKKIRKLFNTIRKSYFGNHFHACESNTLVQKVYEILSKYETLGIWPTREYSKQCLLSTRLAEMDTFVERRMVESTTDLSGIEHNNMFFLNVFDTEYICCRPDRLVQKYGDVLDMFNTRNVLGAKITLDDFTEVFEFQETNIYLSGLAEASLIEEIDDTVYQLSIIMPSCLPQYDESRQFRVVTHVLRLAIDLTIIPTALMVQIIMSCVRLEWTVKTQAPKSIESRDALLLEKGSFGLIMTFDKAEPYSYIGMCIVCFQTDAKNDLNFDCDECDKVRKAVESTIESCSTLHTHKLEKLRICGQCIKNMATKDVWKMCDENWTDISELVSGSKSVREVGDATLLTHWYYAKSKDILESLNKNMSDDVLVRIAELFGKGYELFFIGQRIPSAVVDRIERESRNDMSHAVFRLLKEWIREHGYQANFSNLRGALKEGRICIDLHRFDEIVKESQ